MSLAETTQSGQSNARMAIECCAKVHASLRREIFIPRPPSQPGHEASNVRRSPDHASAVRSIRICQEPKLPLEFPVVHSLRSGLHQSYCLVQFLHVLHGRRCA
eukprot:4894629-Amphidinium_carterae.2